MSAITAAAAAMSAAGFTVRTADALGTALLRLIDVESCAAQNRQNHDDQNHIFHTYFFLLVASSVFSLLSALMHRNTTMPAITTTASRPPVNPTPTEPVVINVPIW